MKINRFNLFLRLQISCVNGRIENVNVVIIGDFLKWGIYMTFEERKAQVKSYLGKRVVIGIDRPIGYVHEKESYSLTYPINYGYIPGVLGGDDEELDVYLLGVNEPVVEYECEIIAIVHRHNDVEDKLVGAPIGLIFTKEEIKTAIHFQEQYYDSEIEVIKR